MTLKTLADRRADGAFLRPSLPRSAHAGWAPSADRPDPVSILLAQETHRIAAMLPLRHARMAESAFAYLRGAAAVMASDLAHTSSTGLRVQACGDAHLDNFGAFASTDGVPMFDINDFDETLPAPFEWDLKRLASSLVVAGADAGLGAKSSHDLARRAACAYRTHMDALASMPPLRAWASQIDLAGAIAEIDNPRARAREDKRLASSSKDPSYGLVIRDGDTWRIRDNPPLVHHLNDQAEAVRAAFVAYAAALPEERRALLDRYALRDVAFKAVGVGSVGTFCGIALYTTADGDPLLLQIKQAEASVLAPFAGSSAYAHQGERVVVGQRLLQSSPDLFLGWTQIAGDPRWFYVRRLKDKHLADLGASLADGLPFYAGLCGRTLARAHARSADPAPMAGYMGVGEVFDDAIADFATAYAEQNALDFAAFQQAIKIGRVRVAA